MAGTVSYRIEDEVAVITVENPPVNALGQAVRAGLREAAARFAADGDARAALIVGSGRLFIGGADILEFGQPAREPGLPDVVNAIEASPKPVVASIHGTALGGGLEVALGAHYRVALAGATLGLPEVKLGILPGAGGTQRLPRLVGLEKALAMITGGEPVSAREALAAGLIDHLDEGGDALAAGLAFARRLLDAGTGPRRVGGLPMPAAPDGLFAEWREKLVGTARGEVAPGLALAAVEAATRLDLAAGLAEERRLFVELMATPQRAALIHAFLAERKVAKLPELDGIAPAPVERIGVVGGGTMGAGIAAACLMSGLPVTLVERDEAAAGKARAAIAKILAAAAKRGKLDAAASERMIETALTTATGYDALAGCDLVIEAVFESMEVKREVFAALDAAVQPGATLATNTSYLDIDAIASATARPEAVLGLHFFSPAHVMRLLEVVVAERTAPERVAAAFALARRLGKIAVRAGVCDGFIGNRIMAHYRTAVDHMVLDGASPYAVDAALRAFGFAMGPFEVADLAGLDIGYATRQRKAAGRHPRDRAASYGDALYHKGRLGQKTGRGYYLYDAGSRKGRPDAEVEALVAAARREAGITPRDFAGEEIVRRTVAAMVNEGARVVGEGIARRPLDIDVTFLYGYGFPRWRGGPMHHADAQGLASILADIRTFAEADDHFWSPAPLLERLVAEGRDFDSLNAERAGRPS